MATTAKKTENFTAEQFAQLRDAYLNPDNVGYDAKREAIKEVAAKIGKSERSCIAKLSREGFYKAKEYTTKNGGKPESKENLAARIAAALGVAVETAESLTKANKAILEKVAQALETA
jgi:hypothetical protein